MLISSRRAGSGLKGIALSVPPQCVSASRRSQFLNPIRESELRGGLDSWLAPDSMI